MLWLISIVCLLLYVWLSRIERLIDKRDKLRSVQRKDYIDLHYRWGVWR